VLLNYKRDGTPFLNLLMIAPLLDNRGRLKYNIGAQVDVSGLVENGRSLETFAAYLSTRNDRRSTDRRSVDSGKEVALNKLRELSEMFDLEESAVVQSHGKSSSSTRSDKSRSRTRTDRPRAIRRLFVSDSGSDEEKEDEAVASEAGDKWKLSSDGGRLPGIYDTYMLIRPSPSYRIIFVSPALQKTVASSKSPLLSHLTASSKTMAGLKKSFQEGVPVSAKVSLSAAPGNSREGKSVNGYKHEDGTHGKAFWISATPLLGSDDLPGVWMVIFVQKSKLSHKGSMKMVDSGASVEKTNTDKEEAPSFSGRNADSSNQPKTEGVALEETPDIPINSAGDLPPVTEETVKNIQVSEQIPIQSTEARDHGVINGGGRSRDQQSKGVSDSQRNLVRAAQVEQRDGLHRGDDDQGATATETPETSAGTSTEEKHDAWTEPAHDADGSPAALAKNQSGQDTNASIGHDSEQTVNDDGVADFPEERPQTPVQDNPAPSEDDFDTPVATRFHTRRSSRSSNDAGSRTPPSIVPTYGSDTADVKLDQAKEANQDDGDNHDISGTPIRPQVIRDTNGPSGVIADYLTHPGSTGRHTKGQADEFGRALVVSRRAEGEDWSDSECFKSPYSVD
jgi:hypothetical protein